MLIWTIVVIFETTWLSVSCEETDGNVVALIQFKHKKYCGKYNCSAESNISQFSDDLAASAVDLDKEFCPPCHRCSCRHDCVVYGDCCPDLHVGPSLFPFKCFGVPYKKNLLQAYMVVTDCGPTSTHYSPELAGRCGGFQRDRIRDGLVSARVSSAAVQTHVTFLNKFCAQCHGVFDSVPWNVIVECKVFPTPTDIADFKDFLSWAANNCWIGFVRPEHRVRKCKVLDSELISTCNATGYWSDYNATIADACSAYYNPLVTEGYRNMFCLICNGFPEEFLESEVLCADVPPLGWGVQPFSAILNFDQTLDELPLNTQCNEGEFLDIISNTCRKILCPPLEQLKGENCTSFLRSARGLVFKLQIVLTPREPLEMSPLLSNGTLIHHVIDKIYDFRRILILNMTLVSYVYETPQWNETKMSKDFERQNQNGSYRTNGTTVDTLGSTSDYTTPQQNTQPPMKDAEIVAYVKITALVTQPLATSISFLVERLLALQYRPLLIYYETEFIIFNCIPSIYFDPNKYNISAEGLKPVLTDRFENDETAIPPTAAVLEIPSPHLECAQIEFQQNEYERAVNDSVFIIPDSLYIYKSNYELTESLKLRVCLDHLKQVINATLKGEVIRADTAAYIKQILTSVCLGVSLVCLLLSFLTHCVFAEMRTLPGMNLMFLTSSLFVSQALYLFGAGATDNRAACTAIGVLIHYSWLVTFAWMDVCSFHVFRVFRNLFSVLTFNDSKKVMLLRYAVFSYTVPGVFIVLHILVHYFALEERSIGYSDEMMICFVNPGLLSVPFFALPAGLTVLLTTAFFVYTSIILHKSSKQRSTVGIKESASVFRFFKLASMTGLSWLFGFLGAILKVDALAYVFIILAGGQGVFVFLSFSFSKRIRDKYVSCLSCVRKKKDQQTNNTTNSTLEILSSDL